MAEPTTLPTQRVKDEESLERMVNGLVERHQEGIIRCGLVLFFDHKGVPHMLVANTTLADESYAVALLQERLMRLLRS